MRERDELSRLFEQQLSLTRARDERQQAAHEGVAAELARERQAVEGLRGELAQARSCPRLS